MFDHDFNLTSNSMSSQTFNLRNKNNFYWNNIIINSIIYSNVDF